MACHREKLASNVKSRAVLLSFFFFFFLLWNTPTLIRRYLFEKNSGILFHVNSRKESIVTLNDAWIVSLSLISFRSIRWKDRFWNFCPPLDKKEIRFRRWELFTRECKRDGKAGVLLFFRCQTYICRGKSFLITRQAKRNQKWEEKAGTRGIFTAFWICKKRVSVFVFASVVHVDSKDDSSENPVEYFRLGVDRCEDMYLRCEYDVKKIYKFHWTLPTSNFIDTTWLQY